MLDFIARDCLGRVATFVWKEGHCLRTPAILFVSTSRIRPSEYAHAILTDTKIDGKVDEKERRDRFVIIDEGSIFSRGEIEIEKDTYYIPRDIHLPLSLQSLHQSALEFIDKSSERIVSLGGKIVYPVNGVGENAGIIARNGLEKFSPEVFALCNGKELLGHVRDFASTIAAFRNALPSNKLLYLPGVALPHNLALFVYLGFDLFDSTAVAFGARKGLFFTNYGAFDSKKMNEIPCFCQACSIARDDEKYRFSYEHLLRHGYNEMISEISNIRNAISNGKIRELVEIRIHAEPWMVSLLRNFDLRHYELQEEFYPISRHANEQLIASSKESLFRPDIVRFKRRIIERYKKPECAKILLLLPCSAKKPYSFSKSHRAFREAIESSGNPNVVHEVILTSPLGLVPRELELFYPAQQYDIPVTGDWDEIEISRIKEMLKWYLSTQEYEEIVVHIPELCKVVENIVYEFEKEKGKELRMHITAKEHATSEDSLERLRDTLEKISSGMEKIGKRRIVEDLRSFARYQFGGASDYLFEGEIDVKGRYPDLKIFREKVQLGMLTGERGMISLTLDGGKALAKGRSYWVEIEDFKIKGNVFAIGVKDASREIRVGDEVVAGHSGEVRAVGVACMTARDMIELNRGEAIRVRHKI